MIFVNVLLKTLKCLLVYFYHLFYLGLYLLLMSITGKWIHTYFKCVSSY